MGEGVRRPCLAGVEEGGEPCPTRQGKAAAVAEEVAARQALQAAAAAEAVAPCLAGEEVEEDHPAPRGVAEEAEEGAGELQSTGEVAVAEEEEAGRRQVASGPRRPLRRRRPPPRSGRSARPCPSSAAGRPPRDERRSLW